MNAETYKTLLKDLQKLVRPSENRLRSSSVSPNASAVTGPTRRPVRWLTGAMPWG